MKWPFARFEVLGLAAVLAAGVACTPNNAVQPGAPVLMELAVVENGGAEITTVTSTTTICPAKTAEGGGCASSQFPATVYAATGQIFYTPCQTTPDNIVCRCVPNPAPPPPAASDAGAADAAAVDAGTASADAGAADAGGSMADAGDAGGSPALDGTWSCSYLPTANVRYVFDRLLNTTPFDQNMGVAVPDVAGVMTMPTNNLVSGLATYNPAGVQNGTIFPMLGFADGPNITVAGSPALPIGNTITVTVDRTKVTAKDGTPFTATGLLIDGTIQFVTQPTFTAMIAGPPLPMVAADAGTPLNLPDNTPATITFTNTVSVDPTAPKTLVGHVIVQSTTGGGTPTDVPVDLATMDGLTVTVTPTAKPAPTTWPKSSHITISLDATATDAVGDLLTAAAMAVSFDTSAM